MPYLKPNYRQEHNKMLESMPLSYLLPFSSSIWINDSPRDGGKTNPHLTHAFVLCENNLCCIPKIRSHQASSEHLQNVCRPSRQLALSNFAFNFLSSFCPVSLSDFISWGNSELICFERCVCVLTTYLCPALCDPVDCSPPVSSVHGILQARVLEWVAISFSRGPS